MYRAKNAVPLMVVVPTSLRQLFFASHAIVKEQARQTTNHGFQQMALLSSSNVGRDVSGYLNMSLHAFQNLEP